MSRKLLFLDVETTGKDPGQHDLIEVAGIIEIDGVIVTSFHHTCRARLPQRADPCALALLKLTPADLSNRPDPRPVAISITNLLEAYLGPPYSSDRFVLVGHSVLFDLQFMNAFLCENGVDILAHYLGTRLIDLKKLVIPLFLEGILPVEDLSLVSLARFWGFSHEPHCALSDVTVTRQIYRNLITIFNRGIQNET